LGTRDAPGSGPEPASYEGSAANILVKPPVEVVMIRTRSDFIGPWVPAREESMDGIDWSPTRAGIVTTGRYALVLRSLQTTTDVIDLGRYEVGIGPLAGMALPEYLRARADKACARLAVSPASVDFRPIGMLADLVPPYAVLLRTPRVEL
jgi:hypothetical protein